MGKTARKVDESKRPITTEEVNPTKKIRKVREEVTASDFAELEDLHRKCIWFPRGVERTANFGHCY